MDDGSPYDFKRLGADLWEKVRETIYQQAAEHLQGQKSHLIHRVAYALTEKAVDSGRFTVRQEAGRCVVEFACEWEPPVS